MAETAIAAVLSKLGSLAASEAKALIEVGDGMMLLRDQLEWLLAFIRDADRKRRAGTDGLSEVWVRQTRNVAFQAEDAIDEFLYEVVLRKQGYYRGWKMWSRYMLGFGTQVVVRHRMSIKINKIKSRLHQITENQKEYKIEHIPFVPLTSSTTAFAAWADDYRDAVGFDSALTTVKNMIFGIGAGGSDNGADGSDYGSVVGSDNGADASDSGTGGSDNGAGGTELMFLRERSELMFICIVGESGVGKRTLGKVLSDNDRHIKREFHTRIRYNVSPDCTTVASLEEIREKCGWKKKEDGDKSQISITSIAAEIRGLLQDKRYLMVLGGITSKTTLNCLRASLPDDKNGSAVVLTLDTESEEVAWHMDPVGINHKIKMHRLGRLDFKTTGELFCKRALRKEQEEEVSIVKMYENDVYDITGGYPLAIVLLAGLLRFKEWPGQWEAVLQHLRLVDAAAAAPETATAHAPPAAPPPPATPAAAPAMPSKRHSTRTMLENVFWESFEDLTNDLKSCFLYFAAYSKNTCLDAAVVVRMWIGEGFIKPEKGKTMEETGQSYLKELILRCLVENLSENASGRITTVTSVRVHPRLLGFLQSEAREAGFLEFRDVNDAFVPPSVRRLSFCSFGSSRCIAFPSKFRKLRSFVCLVDITDGEESMDDKSKASTKLKFLRRSKFLRVVSVVGLRLHKLPREIGALVQLRYLRVNCKGLKRLPPSICRLINLQTLDIRDTQVGKINPCFWKIKTLRHVLAECLTLPATIKEEMDELQTLHGVKPDRDERWNPEECALHKMTKIRSLELHGFRKGIHGAALKSALQKMRILVHLKLKGNEIPSFIFTADNLECLEEIVLEGFVKWEKIPQDVLTRRPNLHHLQPIKCNEVPLDIKKGILKGILPEHDE